MVLCVAISYVPTHMHNCNGIGKQITMDKNVVYTNLNTLCTFFEVLHVHISTHSTQYCCVV